MRLHPGRQASNKKISKINLNKKRKNKRKEEKGKKKEKKKYTHI